MKKLLTYLVSFTLVCTSFSQSDKTEEKNVVISKSKKEFQFVKGNSQYPVQVKEISKKTYTCNSYRTDILISEFYNDIVTIDDVDIYVNESRKHGIIPKHDYHNIDGIFYSDARVCFFGLPLQKKGSTSEVEFKKTTLDPRYFTNIFFVDEFNILEQEIKITIPSWIEVEIKEYNFKNQLIQKKIATGSNETVYTYSMKNVPAYEFENSAPGITHNAPHILVLCKSAQPQNEKFTYFKTLKEQYGWYRSLIEQVNNDKKIIKEKTDEIITGIPGEEEKVKKIFQWVQDNIRYIAFENGIAGFKPERAQEVLKKKYGDCKGMANLLTEMLRSIQLDARLCWIGTKHIAYDYSTPSLSVDNHMICAWMNKGKPVYLDATEKYIGFGEIAERIQGKQTLIENGNQYQLEKVPEAAAAQNTATEIRSLYIEGNHLKGRVVQTWKGENKEWMLASLNNIKQDKQENALKQFLAEGKQNFEIINLKIENISDYNRDLKVEYDVTWKNVITVFNKEAFLDLDNRRHFESFKIDTEKRKLPYLFSFKNNLVFETQLSLSSDKAINSLPEKFEIKKPGYSFAASYVFDKGKIIYRNEITIHKTELRPEEFTEWNKDIERLTDFYNQQIVLTLKN